MIISTVTTTAKHYSQEEDPIRKIRQCLLLSRWFLERTINGELQWVIRLQVRWHKRRQGAQWRLRMDRFYNLGTQAINIGRITKLKTSRVPWSIIQIALCYSHLEMNLSTEIKQAATNSPMTTISLFLPLWTTKATTRSTTIGQSIIKERP